MRNHYLCRFFLVGFCLVAPVVHNAFLVDETELQGSSLQAKKSSVDLAGLVMTSFFRTQKDPQRGKYYDTRFHHIANLYNSANFHGLNTMIFYDDLPDDFISQFTSPHIHFHRVTSYKNYSEMSTNDYRFVAYNEFLMGSPTNYMHIVMVDAFDTFFRRDPFKYMEDKKKPLYISADSGRFHAGAWMTPRCYGSMAKQWDQTLPLYNAGVWGGNKNSTLCMLKCITTELVGRLKGKGNCNMPALNWCGHFSRCSDDPIIPDTVLINPFRRECLNNHTIVHNKCKETEGTVCLKLLGDKMVVVSKQKSEGCWYIGNNNSTGEKSVNTTSSHLVVQGNRSGN